MTSKIIAKMCKRFQVFLTNYLWVWVCPFLQKPECSIFKINLDLILLCKEFWNLELKSRRIRKSTHTPSPAPSSFRAILVNPILVYFPFWVAAAVQPCYMTKQTPLCRTSTAIIHKWRGALYKWYWLPMKISLGKKVSEDCVLIMHWIIMILKSLKFKNEVQ